jgi:hypothetical protein
MNKDKGKPMPMAIVIINKVLTKACPVVSLTKLKAVEYCPDIATAP